MKRYITLLLTLLLELLENAGSARFHEILTSGFQNFWIQKSP